MSFLSRLLGGSREKAELTPEEIYQWQEKLGAPDYEFCVELLEEEFRKRRPRKRLLALFEAYRKEPGLRAAVAMIKYDARLLGLFATSAKAKKLRQSMIDEFEGG
jgi:hypothetical protein